jgi:glycosyltransferase involved in cell wall biosynthesis
MRFLFLAGRETSYPRNDVMIRALKRLGDVDVVGSTQRGSILFSSLSVTLKLLLFQRSRDYDLVFVGFYGQLLMFPVSIWSSSPVVFDALISTYDTLCFDRKVFSPGSFFGRIAYWLDISACERSNLVLLDTLQHLNYFQEIYALPEAFFSVVPVSCNENLFYPREDSQILDNRVLFYSTYLPVHGVETIIEAIALLDSPEDLEFILVGEGPGLRQSKQLATEMGLKNISFLPYLPIIKLADEIAVAGICLGGHYGKTDKADRVVPTKIYQMMAMAKPMIAGDTSANRELLAHGESALLCPPADPASLADAIRVLQKDPSLRKKLGISARQRFDQVCSEEAVTKQLEEIIRKILIG